MILPILVAEHYIRSAVGAMLIGWVKETAKIGLNACCVEVVPGHFIDPGGGRSIAGVQPYFKDGISRQALKAAVAITQIAIVRIRLRRVIIAPALDCPEALLPRHLQRVMYQP